MVVGSMLVKRAAKPPDFVIRGQPLRPMASSRHRRQRLKAAWEVGAHIRNEKLCVECDARYFLLPYIATPFFFISEAEEDEFCYEDGGKWNPTGFHFLVGAGLAHCRKCRALSANATATT